MKKVKEVLNILKYNITTLIGFELIFKFLSLMFFTPIFLKSFTLIMKITGYNYITLENIFSFLTKPITIIMLLILLLLMMIYAMFDIITIIVILDCSYHRKKIKIIDAIRNSLSRCRNLFHIKNITLAILVLFLIPFLNVGISSSFIATIKIPEFIMDFILDNKLLFILFIGLLTILLITLLQWLYSLHYFVLENVNFKEARKRSKKLIKKHYIKDFITLFLVQLAIFILYCIYIIFGILLILIFNKIFGKYIIIKSILATIIWFFIALSFIFITLLSTPISYASISVMYYFHKKDNLENVKSIPIKMNDNNPRKIIMLKRIIAIVCLICLIFGTYFTYGLYKGKYNLNIEYVRTIEITAHRGASFNYPENTMSAFKGAKDMGADWVELDVQQTKDGQIIVSHDTNLLRVTGLNKNIIDLNYEDIKDLDAGSFFSSKFKNEKIPLFEKVVKWAKDNNMKLNVELKPTGKEKDFEKEVIDIIKKYNYEDYCVITSQVYKVLENAKKYDKNIKTVYVMSLAIGDIILLDKADAFSVEASNINKTLIDKVHKEGKEIYAWTINTKENIQKMIEYNVDNIITDNITDAKKIVLESKTSNLINEFIKFTEKYL